MESCKSAPTEPKENPPDKYEDPLKPSITNVFMNIESDQLLYCSTVGNGGTGIIMNVEPSFEPERSKPQFHWMLSFERCQSKSDLPKPK